VHKLLRAAIDPHLTKHHNPSHKLQMISQEALNFWSQFLARTHISKTLHAHIVLGSGFGSALSQLPQGIQWDLVGELPFANIPGFHSSTVPDHAGLYRFYKHKAMDRFVCFQLGRLHGYEGHSPTEVVSTVMLSRLTGTSKFLLTNAAGGLGATYKPGDIMLLKDHVNLTGKNPLIGKNPKGPDNLEIGPRFPDLSQLYGQDLRLALGKSLLAQGLTVHEGIYLGVLGPSFETPAEVRLFQQWGMGAVGMSTVWEAIALAHSGASVAGLSLISNLGAGLVNQVLDHHKILETSRAAAASVAKGVFAWVEEI
jgi:purine-nucleoside phosphorylase